MIPMCRYRRVSSRLEMTTVIRGNYLRGQDETGLRLVLPQEQLSRTVRRVVDRRSFEVRVVITLDHTNIADKRREGTTRLLNEVP